MIAVDKALEFILSQPLPQETEVVDLKNALGKVLAELVRADRDAPPFDRVTMDGIALHAALLGKQLTFKIEKIQAAGAERSKLIDTTGCIEVMTGAILPENTDCVIPYEQIEIKDGMAKLLTPQHVAGQNIHRQGTDAKEQDILLDRGRVISPSVIGVLASVGIAEVKVLKIPKVAVCSTGDELVDIEEQPKLHQIRKSNAYMLGAALLDLGIGCDMFHLLDDKDSMARQLYLMLKEYPLILLSGAVSKGKYDFLPEVLQELGMEKIIHGVAQRPGKPLLFGVLAANRIFGFPGNPASTFVCFHSYFKPWIRQYLGLTHIPLTAVLDHDITFDKPLTYHVLVRLSQTNGKLTASPVQHSGSGDLVHLAEADAILSLPADRKVFLAGEAYPVNRLRKDFF